MCTERKSLTKECGWKDGDRGGLAEWEQTHGKKKTKVCLDINRPSHGRTYPTEPTLYGLRVPSVIRSIKSTWWYVSLISVSGCAVKSG